jgi:hypothetical protein
VAIALQSLLQEGPEDDLKAHRQLESDRRLSCDDAGLVQDVLREDEKNSGPIFAHRHPCPLAESPALRAPHLGIPIDISYISYMM